MLLDLRHRRTFWAKWKATPFLGGGWEGADLGYMTCIPLGRRRDSPGVKEEAVEAAGLEVRDCKTALVALSTGGRAPGAGGWSCRGSWDGEGFAVEGVLLITIKSSERSENDSRTWRQVIRRERR